jgi:hypothetical protein
MRVHIDEAGCHVQAAGIDNAARPDVLQVADGGDPVAGDGDVGVVPRVSGAVYHAPVPYQQVVRLLRRRRQRQGGE